VRKKFCQSQQRPRKEKGKERSQEGPKKIAGLMEECRVERRKAKWKRVGKMNRKITRGQDKPVTP